MDQHATILGIDPGLNISGYGVIENEPLQVIEAGVIEVPRNQSIEKRLRCLYDGVCNVIESLKPDCLAVEDLYSHYERPKTAIIMGHARGVILLAAQVNGLQVHSYAATRIKSMLTGNGRASKSQMQAAVTSLFELQVDLEPPDVADALAVALCHRHQIRNRFNGV